VMPNRNEGTELKWGLQNRIGTLVRSLLGRPSTSPQYGRQTTPSLARRGRRTTWKCGRCFRSPYTERCRCLCIEKTRHSGHLATLSAPPSGTTCGQFNEPWTSDTLPTSMPSIESSLGPTTSNLANSTPNLERPSNTSTTSLPRCSTLDAQLLERPPGVSPRTILSQPCWGSIGGTFTETRLVTWRQSRRQRKS
jgi:hypothetical protein